MEFDLRNGYSIYQLELNAGDWIRSGPFKPP